MCPPTVKRLNRKERKVFLLLGYFVRKAFIDIDKNV